MTAPGGGLSIKDAGVSENGGADVVKGRIVAILIVFLAAGCFGQKPLTEDQMLRSSAGVEREEGVLKAGQQGSTAIPTLIQRLEDDDVAVRLAAINTLRRTTGQDFGYVAWDDEVKRRPAVAKWREWWRQGGHSPPAASTGGQP